MPACVEPDGRGVRVTNTNAFQGTSGTVFVARMLLDGREAWSKSYEFEVAAGSARSFDIGFLTSQSARRWRHA